MARKHGFFRPHVLGLTAISSSTLKEGVGVPLPDWVPTDDDGDAFLFVFDIENDRGWFNGVEYESAAAFLTAVGGTNNGDGTYTIGPASNLPFPGFDLTKGTIVDKWTATLASTAGGTMAWTIQASGVLTDYIRSLAQTGSGQYKTTFDVVRANTLQGQQVTPNASGVGVHRHCMIYETNNFTMHANGDEIGLPDGTGSTPVQQNNMVLMLGHRSGSLKISGTGTIDFWAYTPKVVSRTKRRVLSGGEASGLDGIWGWFSDERAFALGDGTPIIGAIGQNGDVLASQVGGSPVVLKGAMEVDDHTNPAFVRLANGKILAHYRRHTAVNFYQRISVNADDISEWGPEVDLDPQFGLAQYAYAHPIQMANGTIYTFFRASDNVYERTWHYSKSADNGATWSTAVRILDSSSGVRPYVHCVRNGNSRIDFVASTGNPSEVADCSLYHFYMDTSDDSFHATGGSSLVAPFLPSAATEVWDGSTAAGEGWSWDIRPDGSASPVIVFAAFVSTSDHRYHYATTDGSTWTTNEICAAGGTVMSFDTGYSGGVVLDHEDTSIVYCSRKGANGVFDLWKAVTVDGGANWSLTQLTTKQENSFRPFKIAGTNKLAHVRGPFVTNNAYYSRIETIDVA